MKQFNIHDCSILSQHWYTFGESETIEISGLHDKESKIWRYIYIYIYIYMCVCVCVCVCVCMYIYVINYTYIGK